MTKLRWTRDAQGRFRSPDYLAWIRSLRCSCGGVLCGSCNSKNSTLPRGRIIAAHVRYGAAVGMGVKPDDFCVIPLDALVHQRFHDHGHPDLKWQVERLIQTWRMGFECHVLELSDASLAEVVCFGQTLPY